MPTAHLIIEKIHGNAGLCFADQQILQPASEVIIPDNEKLHQDIRFCSFDGRKHFGEGAFTVKVEPHVVATRERQVSQPFEYAEPAAVVGQVGQKRVADVARPLRDPVVGAIGAAPRIDITAEAFARQQQVKRQREKRCCNERNCPGRCSLGRAGIEYGVNCGADTAQLQQRIGGGQDADHGGLAEDFG